MTDTTTTLDELLARAHRLAFLAPLQTSPEEERDLYTDAGRALSQAMHQETTEEAQNTCGGLR
ncbi:MAG: hypothetical protein IT487_04005 [Chromatiaceae bacterium]|nr:hypothetical protein [Chromatiaceae bacterium]